MFARILFIPIVLVALLFLYLAWEVDSSYGLYLIPPVVLGALVYVLGPQINWWWYNRHPADLEPSLRALLERAPGLYQQLSPEEKLRFRQRTALFVMGNDYIPQGMETVPSDAQAVVAASAVTLTFRQEEFRFPKYEHIVLYPHPFPSPQYPDQFHISEVYDADGVLLFSLEPLFRGFLQPDQFFHIGLYEYAKVYRRSYPFARYPEVEDAHWPVLERISGFSQDWISKWINVPDIDPVAVAIAHFFIFPEAFEREWPEAFQQFRVVFRT